MNETRTILMVDDSENDLFLMRAAFARAGLTHPLQEVHNGEQAIAYLKGDPPYDDRAKFPLPVVMLLDLNMPRRSGFDVLMWVRTNPGLKRLSIVVVSASMRGEDVDRAFDVGANSFVIKPTTMEELTSMVKSLGEWIRHNHFPALAAEEPKP